MNMNFRSLAEKMTSSAPIVLRIGMSLIILWFGIQQIIDVTSWIGYLPEWTATLPVSQSSLVYLNGSFEIIFGVFMLLGFYTRISALFLALHLFDIVYLVGYDATGMRDLGLAIAISAIFLYGPDRCCIDERGKKNIPAPSLV